MAYNNFNENFDINKNNFSISIPFGENEKGNVNLSFNESETQNGKFNVFTLDETLYINQLINSASKKYDKSELEIVVTQCDKNFDLPLNNLDKINYTKIENCKDLYKILENTYKDFENRLETLKSNNISSFSEYQKTSKNTFPQKIIIFNSMYESLINDIEKEDYVQKIMRELLLFNRLSDFGIYFMIVSRYPSSLPFYPDFYKQSGFVFCNSYNTDDKLFYKSKQLKDLVQKLKKDEILIYNNNDSIEICKIFNDLK